jgi:hypothetical protein
MRYFHYSAIFIGSVIIQYFLILPAIVDDLKNINLLNVNKLYISLFQGFFALLLEIMLHDYKYNVISKPSYIIILLLIALLVYLYRNQIFIDDKQYLHSIKEQLSVSILRSKEVIKKTNNYEVSKTAKDILQSQTDDIRTINEITKKL